MNLIPTILESSNKGEYICDIYSKLLKERIIFITGEINDKVSNLIIAQMLYLEHINHKKDIYLYINSYGGSVSAGISIYDTINFLRSDVSTICIGQAYSIAAFLLSVGTKGKRYSLPNSHIMIHQPIGQCKGQATEIEIYTKEILKTKKLINHLLSVHTGKDIKIIEQDTDRDCFLTPIEALEYGLIDKITEKHMNFDNKKK